MHTKSLLLNVPQARPADSWAVLTGRSVGIVAGFGIDLLRLGAHSARHAFSARSANPHWPCPGGPCDAGAR
jgi:hypothetical protein